MSSEDNSIRPDMWGEKSVAPSEAIRSRGRIFQDGNYGMFVHWGLYSMLGGEWKNRIYYGIGEWIMDENMANISVEEYEALAHDFNPVHFNAKDIVLLAKDAGMKYVVLTSKHHEGFAMFKSDHPFNVVEAAPFHRDPMKELAEACHEAGLGFGVYYSHFQDWTAPGGGRIFPSGGGSSDDDAFRQYFKEKCYPQVREICTGYGPLEVIWFDTPGDMPKDCILALHDLVRETQPEALLGSRIGFGLGDYSTQGDMEIPIEKVDGLWETCDTTNDSWSYTAYDTNWKDSKEILLRLISTVARGGTYLLNVGPDGAGRIPDQCQRFLRGAGEWIARYPEVIYGASSSPWRFAMPWGDIVTREGNILYLLIFLWPEDGRLYLPGLQSQVLSAQLLDANDSTDVSYNIIEKWIELSLPSKPINEMVAVVKMTLSEEAAVATNLPLHPNFPNRISSHFAEVLGAEKETVQWMEKFGEWKHVVQISNWQNGSSVQWEVDIISVGTYRVSLTYRSKEPAVWKIETDQGSIAQNQQPATSQFGCYPIGMIEFKNLGRHLVKVSLLTKGDSEVGLSHIHLQKAIICL